MRFWIVKNDTIPFGRYDGIVLYPFVFIKNDKDILFRHELEHCYQIARKGVVRFYWDYLVDLVKHGYANHPDEVEAYIKQYKPLTLQEKQWQETGVIDIDRRVL